MIVDTMVGSLFQHHNIHAIGMRQILCPHLPALVHNSLLSAVGADRIARNGDTANKVCNTHFMMNSMVLTSGRSQGLSQNSASKQTQWVVKHKKQVV